MVLIGLIGKKQVGKDTVADFLVKHHDYVKYAFAQPLKKACQILFLLSEEQLQNGAEKEKIITEWQMSPRQILQFVGTDLIRTHFRDDFWIHHFRQWYKTTTSKNVVVSDVRFQNEADAILALGGKLIKIERHNFCNDPHLSEQQEIFGYDYTIKNNESYAVLYDTIMQILKTI